VGGSFLFQSLWIVEARLAACDPFAARRGSLCRNACGVRRRAHIPAGRIQINRQVLQKE